MITGVIVCFILAAAIAAPTTKAPVSDELLRKLINPTPEVMEKLNAMSAALRSQAAVAAVPGASEAAPVEQQASNLNLGGLNNIILSVVKSVLERMSPETPSQPIPTNPTTDIFGNPIPQPVPGPIPGHQPGPVVDPNASRAPVRRPSIFNPLKFLFPGTGSGGPFGMMFPSMMFDLMEGFMEFF